MCVRIPISQYAALRAFARRLECGGLTDYEAPIKLTLDEFAADRRLRSPYVPKHVLFITDGHPTKGDRHCVEARQRMRRAGVQVSARPTDRDHPRARLHACHATRCVSRSCEEGS